MKLVFAMCVAVAAGCCSSWLGDEQTSKNGGFVSPGNSEAAVYVPVIEAPSATTVKELQIGAEFDLLRDLSQVGEGGCACPATSCAYCRYYINWALVIDVGQGVSLELFNFGTTLQNDLFPLSLPANDSNVLTAGVSTVQCFNDRVSFSYNSAQDPYFALRFADGITLNQGESIVLVWQYAPQDSLCVSLDGVIGVEGVGWYNYLLNYAECLEFHPKYYATCVKELESSGRPVA